MSWTEMETGLTFLMLTPPLAAVSTSALWAQGILHWIVLSVWQCVFYTLRCEHLTRLYHTDHTPATKYRVLQLQNENLWHVKLEIEIFVHILSPNPVVNQRLHPSHRLNTEPGAVLEHQTNITTSPVTTLHSTQAESSQVLRLWPFGKTIQWFHRKNESSFMFLLFSSSFDLLRNKSFKL